MFETILWAKAAEKAGEMSLNTVEQIIQNQHNLLSLTLIALVAIAGIIAAGSFVYNIYISRRKLEDIKVVIEAKLTDKINDKFEESLKKMNETTGSALTRLDKAIRSDSAAATAIVAETQNSYVIAAAAWTGSLHNAIDIKDEERIGDRTERLILALKKLKKNQLNDEIVAKIMSTVSTLPPILSPRKSEIEKIFVERGFKLK